MIKVLNRMAWILSIVVGVSIFAVDDDFFFFGLVAIFVTKFILSEQFIKSSIEEYENKFKERMNLRSKIMNNSIEEKKQEIEEKEEILKENPKQKNIVKDEKITSNVKKEVVKIPKEPSKIEKFLTEFFAENLMAKIGGILLTLGIIFLMSLVYTLVGPVLKIIIGFAVGFIVYFIGAILNKKGFKTESMILLGTGILINYVVILGGRFIIG